MTMWVLLWVLLLAGWLLARLCALRLWSLWRRYLALTLINNRFGARGGDLRWLATHRVRLAELATQYARYNVLQSAFLLLALILVLLLLTLAFLLHARLVGLL